MEWPKRDRFQVKKGPNRVPTQPVIPVLPPPEGVNLPMLAPPTATEPIGPTRVFEWLLVDIRIGKLVPEDSKLYAICKGLADKGMAGVESATYIIDLLGASEEDRQFLLNRANWPRG